MMYNNTINKHKMFKKIHIFMASALFIVLGIVGTVHYSNAIAYLPAPSIISINPNNGPVSGNTSVTITGNNFSSDTKVSFDGILATNVSLQDNQIIALTPPHSVGSVNVLVSNQTGSSLLSNAYTYFEVTEANQCDKKKKVAICHLPSKDNEKAITLCLPESAIKAHLDHGDYLGNCK